MNTLSVKDLLGARVINPLGNHKTSMKVLEDKNDNSAFISYYQYNINAKDIKKDVLFALLSRYLSQPFFNELRTEQQLGYVVHSTEYAPRLV